MATEMKTPGQVLFEDTYLGSEQKECWSKLTDCGRSSWECRAQKVLAHANPWLDIPDVTGWWLIEEQIEASPHRYSVTNICEIALAEPYFQIWCRGKKFQRIIGSEATKQSLPEGRL